MKSAYTSRPGANAVRYLFLYLDNSRSRMKRHSTIQAQKLAADSVSILANIRYPTDISNEDVLVLTQTSFATMIVPFAFGFV